MARLAAISDLPTPPLPPPMASMRRPGRSKLPPPCPPSSSSDGSIFVNQRMPRSDRVASRLLLAVSGLSVVFCEVVDAAYRLCDLVHTVVGPALVFSQPR